ncbi:MAG: hypothetical protein ABIE70_06970 [bacterium]
MKSLIALAMGAALFLAVLTGCDEKPPSRQHIPLLRQALQKMERAVAAENRAAIDSLLSIDILEYEQGSDSLLSLVSGPQGACAFERFELGEITYTGNKARIDCFVMDSLHQRDRPLTFTLVYEHDKWLFKRFEVDSLASQQ